MQLIDDIRNWNNELTGNPGVGGRSRAVARAARWQVAARLGASRARVQVGPAKLFCYPGSTEGSGALYTGFLEWNETAFVLRYLRPGDHFVDVGANIGTFSSFASAFIGDLTISSAEPGEAFDRLVENLELNAVPTDRAHRCAVGLTEGEVKFTTGRDVMNSIAVDGDVEAHVVQQLTLDTLTRDRAADLVKIDVEGAELDVFRGAINTLRDDDPPVLLFELNGRCREFGHDPAEVTGFIRSLGFECFEYDGVANRLQPFCGDGIPESNNLIATANFQAVTKRLNESPLANELAPITVRSSIDWRNR